MHDRAFLHSTDIALRVARKGPFETYEFEGERHTGLALIDLWEERWRHAAAKRDAERARAQSHPQRRRRKGV